MDEWTPAQRRLVIGVVLAVAAVALATQYFVTPTAGTQPFVVWEQTADIPGTNPTQYAYEWKAYSKDQTINECYSEWTVGFAPGGVPPQNGGQTLRNGLWAAEGQTTPNAPPESVYRCDVNNKLVFVTGTDGTPYVYDGAAQTWTSQNLPPGAVPLPLVLPVQGVACTDTGTTQGDVAVWRCEAPFQKELASIPRASIMQLFLRGRYNEIVAPWSAPYLIGALTSAQSLRIEIR
jgi:hypothetical protein